MYQADMAIEKSADNTTQTPLQTRIESTVSHDDKIGAMTGNCDTSKDEFDVEIIRGSVHVNDLERRLLRKIDRRLLPLLILM